MQIWRTSFKAAALAVGLVWAFPHPGLAQTDKYPSRVITLVVPYLPGGAPDVIGRLAAQHLSNDLGQNVIVENRPGAGGTVGTGVVVKAPPDGYTLLLGSTDTIVINAHFYKKLTFNPLTDLTPIAMISYAPEFVLVNASLPVASLREFIDFARAKSGELNYSSPGIGTIPHLAGNRLARLIGTKMTHIPFRGGAPATQEVASGNVQLTIMTKATADPFAQAGKVKILAIASGKRFDGLPDVPTTAEAGLPGYEIDNWWGIFAPQGTSPEIIARLNSGVQKMVADPATEALFKRQGFVPIRTSVQEFVELIHQSDPRWKEIVTQAGVQAE
jgi:tripartite-type tricarboxylate transporter receptor subunit TctC